MLIKLSIYSVLREPDWEPGEEAGRSIGKTVCCIQPEKNRLNWLPV